MELQALASLLLDDRIRFLVGFVMAAVILTIGLIVLESILKERARKKNRKLQQTPADRIKIYLASGKSTQDKLVFLDKIGKDYFSDVYGFPVTSSYSFLIKELKKKNRDIEIKFCDEMFSVFYSKKEITMSEISNIGKILIEIEQHRTIEKKDLSKINSDKMKIPVVGIKKKLAEKESKINIPIFSKVASKKEKDSDVDKDATLKKQEMLVGDVKKMAAEDEAGTKKKLDEFKISEEKQRQEEERVKKFEDESEDRIKERKSLVDDRVQRRALAEEEKKKKLELEKKRNEDDKQRKKEMFWRSRAERQERLKRKDRDREDSKKLLLQKREQERKERRILKEEKIEKFEKEKIGFFDAEKNKLPGNEGVAARIIRQEREKLGLGSQ